MAGIGLSFKNSGLDPDRKIWQSAYLCCRHNYASPWQWCKGSGFWSPIRPDICFFWIWIGLDIVFLLTGVGSGLSKWNKIWQCKNLGME